KDDHKSKTYAHVIRHIAEEMYPPEKYSRITIVEDNLSSHKLSTLYEIMSPEEAREIIRRIEIVRTPPHGSWLNIAELELSLLTRIGLDNRIDTKEMLERKVKDWYQMRNDKIAKVNWTFTSKDARIKLKRLYTSLDRSEEAREIIRRIEIVRTPPHGSWLNIAELELSLLTRIGLDNRI